MMEMDSNPGDELTFPGNPDDDDDDGKDISLGSKEFAALVEAAAETVELDVASVLYGDDRTPRDGMVFKSYEEVLNFYRRYALRTGVSVKIGEADVMAINNFFTDMQTRQPKLLLCHGFLCRWPSILRSVLWADSRSGAAYQYFGDVVLVDTTCLRNKYRWCWASSNGVCSNDDVAHTFFDALFRSTKQSQIIKLISGMGDTLRDESNEGNEAITRGWLL